MADKSRASQDLGDDQRRVWLYLIWALAAGLWLLLAAALISYDPADWPGRFVAPHNAQTHNLVGPVGAAAADELYVMLGPGVWVIMAGGVALLVVTAQRRTITQPMLRAVGLVLMCLGTSALAGVTMTRDGGSPVGAGGLIANFINSELIVRFSMLGTLLILLVGFWVGAILAMDQTLTVLGRLAIRGGAFVGTHVRIARPVLVGKLPRFSFVGAGVKGAAAVTKIPLRASGKLVAKTASDDDEVIDPDAGGLGATESFDPDEQPEADAPTDSHENVADAPDISVGVKKRFTPEQLRAKIRQLPINFAPKAAAQTPPPRPVDLSGYRFPEVALLEEHESSFTVDMERIVRDHAAQLEGALQQYRIDGEVVGIDSGPVITLFEVRLAPGTKVAQVNSVASDIARSLKAHNIRIVANMAGKDTVGIEVPNLKKEKVRLKELMTASSDLANRMTLPMWLGKDASGNPLIADLAAMPHMLIAGTTGSGKSVCINSIIMSFLFTRRPDELKLVLVDPKMVEMGMFAEIPHLMCPVVTEMNKAAAILEWATTKMDERYEMLAEAGVRDLASYNKLTWEELKERFEPSNEEEEARIPRKLPYIVFVVDELADLMMTSKEVEGFIVRLAQKSRAIGMHLILATQRPQANVVTGLIKSNMPCRVAFKVASGMDSRIILDHKGAELLLGQGDMLYLSPRTSKLIRAQGTLVDDTEIRRTVRFLKTVAGPSFEPQLVQIKSPGPCEDDGERDPLFDRAVEVVIETRRGSVSLLQRRLTIGYGRASRLIEQIAAAGIIGDYKGSQAREVQLSLEEWRALRAQAEADATEGSGDTVAPDTIEQPDTDNDEYEYEEDGKEQDIDEEHEDNEEDEGEVEASDEDEWEEDEQDGEDEGDEPGESRN